MPIKIKSRSSHQVRANLLVVKKGTPEERTARGQEQREKLSRSDLGELEVQKRKLDVVRILKQYEADRLPETHSGKVYPDVGIAICLLSRIRGFDGSRFHAFAPHGRYGSAMR